MQYLGEGIVEGKIFLDGGHKKGTLLLCLHRFRFRLWCTLTQTILEDVLMARLLPNMKPTVPSPLDEPSPKYSLYKQYTEWKYAILGCVGGFTSIPT